MEPVRGGMLAKLNPDARKVYRDADPTRTPASWAMQWIASKPNVLTVLSGMSNMDQLKDNLNTFTNFEPMNNEQYAVVDKALEAFQRVKPVLCSECEYCMNPPCPAGVNIPLVFKTYNHCVSESLVPDLNGPRDKDFKRKRRAFLKANFELDKKIRADKCNYCKVCMPKCPQNIPISDKMQEIKGLMDALL
jgi:predicted aldo/keto reductase-like oxidoreductase